MKVMHDQEAHWRRVFHDAKNFVVTPPRYRRTAAAVIAWSSSSARLA
jgi:hypothetical protein